MGAHKQRVRPGWKHKPHTLDAKVKTFGTQKIAREAGEKPKQNAGLRDFWAYKPVPIGTYLPDVGRHVLGLGEGRQRRLRAARG